MFTPSSLYALSHERTDLQGAQPPGLAPPGLVPSTRSLIDLEKVSSYRPDEPVVVRLPDSNSSSQSANSDNNLSVRFPLSRFKFRRIAPEFVPVAPPPSVDDIFGSHSESSQSRSGSQSPRGEQFSNHPSLQGPRSNSPSNYLTTIGKRPRPVMPPAPELLWPLLQRFHLFTLDPRTTRLPHSPDQAWDLVDSHPLLNRRLLITIEILDHAALLPHLKVLSFHVAQIAVCIATDGRYRKGLPPLTISPAGYHDFARLFNSVNAELRRNVIFAVLDPITHYISILEGRAPRLSDFEIPPCLVYPHNHVDHRFTDFLKRLRTIRFGADEYARRVILSDQAPGRNLSINRFTVY